MPSFKQNGFATPFGRNVYLRSTVGIKTISRTVAAYTVPARTIDGFAGQKVLQPGTVLAVITAGAEAGKVGPYQAAGTNEVQTIEVTGSPTGGTYTLTFDGQTTTALAYNANAAAILAALEALSNVDAGDLTVTGTNPFTVTFIGKLGGANQSQLTSTPALTGGSTPTVAHATSTPGVAGATDGRQTAANIVGICNTILPWQLVEGDREVAVVYDADVYQANCIELNAAGAEIALSNTTAAEMFAKKTLAITFAV